MIFRPDQSIVTFLNLLRSTGLLNGAQLCLYTADHPYDAGDVASDYTSQEATFGGYSRRVLSTWTSPSVLLSVASTTADGEIWEALGGGLPQPIWGIFLLSAGGLLLYAEQDPVAPINLTVIGQTYSYFPRFSDRNIV